MRLFGSLKELVDLVFRRSGFEITLKPNASTTFTASRTFSFPNQDASTTLVSTDATQILTGKTIDGDDNTVQDLALATLKTVIGDANEVIRRDSTGAVVAGPVTISDAGIIAAATQLNVDNLRLDGNTLSATDVNGDITVSPAGTGSVLLDPAGTGVVKVVGANLEILSGNDARFYDDDNSNYANLGSPSVLTGNRNVAFPDADGVLVLDTATQTLSAKTLSSPIVTGTLLLQNTSGSQPVLQLSEDPDNGTNKITVQAPASLTTDYTLTLPSDDGASSQFLQTDGSGGLTWATPSSAQDSALDASNLEFSATVASNALTIALKTGAGSDPSGGDPVTVAFRDSTATSGSYTIRTATAATSVVISSGSTLGHKNGQAHYVYLYALDNVGTIELAVSSKLHDDGSLQSTLAEGGAGGADSATAIYSITARSNVPIRILGRLRSTQTTAGTWASAPTEVTTGPFSIADSGTFVVNFNTGMRAGPNNVTVTYRKIDGMVTLSLPQTLVTADATSAAWSTNAGDIPAPFRPVTNAPRYTIFTVDAGTQDTVIGSIEPSLAGNIEITRYAGSWSNTTTNCGFQAISVTYPVT